jgi:hypothetical protein
LAAASALAALRFALSVSSLRLRLRLSSFCLSRTGWLLLSGEIGIVSLHTIAEMGLFVNNFKQREQNTED